MLSIRLARSARSLALFAAGALCALPHVQAATIDFNSLLPAPGDGTVNRGCTYSEDGFTLDNLNCGGGGDFKSIHPGNFRYSDSVSFYNNVQLGVTRLTKTGGGSFALDSIDLDGLNFAVATTVTFIGTLLDASTVTQTFNTDAVFPNRQTFLFSAAFDAVTQVTWTQIGGAPGAKLPFHQFDNIVVAPAVKAVPEPATLVLLAMGLALLRVMRVI